MPEIVTPRTVLHGSTRVKLMKESRRTKDARYRTRCLIVLRSGDGWSVRRIAKALSCSISTVSKTSGRFEAFGLAGSIDRREDNGDRKADELYMQTVHWLLEGTPLDRGLSRPTWTKRLLIDQAHARTEQDSEVGGRPRPVRLQVRIWVVANIQPLDVVADTTTDVLGADVVATTSHNVFDGEYAGPPVALPAYVDLRDIVAPHPALDSRSVPEILFYYLEVRKFVSSDFIRNTFAAYFPSSD